MVDLSEFLDAVDEIRAEAPTYREGGTGDDGTCDCVGLLLGALMRCGVSGWPMHSSNWFARYYVDELLPLSEIQTGMAVFKTRDGSSILNSRYLSGGRYWTGDITDYYHIGVVVSTNPISIVHCTSSNNINGITEDSTTKNWGCCGWIKSIKKDDESMKAGIVYSADGGAVRLRKAPDRKSITIAKIPAGSAINVISTGSGWVKSEYQGKTGYMMAEYVQIAEQQGQQPEQQNDCQNDVVDRLDRIIDLLSALLDSHHFADEENG